MSVFVVIFYILSVPIINKFYRQKNFLFHYVMLYEIYFHLQIIVLLYKGVTKKENSSASVLLKCI